MKNKILAFLYGDSQLESEIEEVSESLDAIMEEAEELEPLKAKRTPLATALKDAGVSAEGVELGPEGFSLGFDNEADYAEACSKLMEPDGMEALAEKGWVAARQGDKAMSGETAGDWRIRFIDITTPDPEDKTDWPAPNDKLMTDIIKKGREFATTPFERDPNNPVEDAEAMDKKKAGMGKEKDGADPEGKPKGSTKSESKEVCRIKGCKGKVVDGARDKYGPGFQGLCQAHVESQQDREKRTGAHETTIRRSLEGKAEAKELADWLLSGVNEGGHKAGCSCGFCKNKGRFGKAERARPKSDEDEESGGLDSGDTTTDSSEMKGGN